jgi:hypothetical protein
VRYNDGMSETQTTEEPVRFTVILPSDLYVMLKTEAAKRRKPAKDVVTSCLRSCLESAGTYRPAPDQ